MLLRLLAVFCLIPLIELAILLWLATRISWPWTLALVIVTGILGAWLARQQGWRTWVRARQRLEEGQMPLEAVGDGLMILLAGALLLTPGVLTDLVGFALLVPQSRRAIRRWLSKRLASRLQWSSYGPDGQASGADSQGRTRIIDVQIIERPPESPSSSDERKP